MPFPVTGPKAGTMVAFPAGKPGLLGLAGRGGGSGGCLGLGRLDHLLDAGDVGVAGREGLLLEGQGLPGGREGFEILP